MSGGVDSSVVAFLMAQGYKNVTGVYMANWSMPRTQDLESGMLCTETDWADVQSVCESLAIPSIRLSFEKDYWTEVFDPMLRQYEAGTTPNPDVSCNKYIKFGKLYDAVEKMAQERKTGKWWLVTGHYARVARHIPTGQTHLLRPADSRKDQTYYLSNIDHRRLPNILFPLHQYSKPEIRQIAVDNNLPTAYRPDSQGLCFVSGYTHFREFLAEFIDPNPGDVVTVDGKVVGKHDGLWGWTVGQRSGVTMPQGDPECAGAWYVVDKRIATNEVVIARGRINEWLLSDAITCTDWTWMAAADEVESLVKLAEDGKLQVRIRSLSDPEAVSKLEILPGGEKVAITFARPLDSVASGQTTVVYSGDRLLGGGPVEDRRISVRAEAQT
ncbi:tRNA-specific 2-thiouridylase [Myxozyma melibiosi]|uniref:tRNA-5-taurinomethyluridine 2-sulfurtransferase n=1 Tax=Myxozyma melibiosi TaxID=54550 RepID=A0ABR1F2S4_9ASCO